RAHLRQEHRSEFARADKHDTQRLTLRLACLQQMMEGHVRFSFDTRTPAAAALYAQPHKMLSQAIDSSERRAGPSSRVGAIAHFARRDAAREPQQKRFCHSETCSSRSSIANHCSVVRFAARTHEEKAMADRTQ